MAIDSRNKRGSAIGINPLSPVLPNPDGTIDAGDRAMLDHAYAGFYAGGAATGTNSLLEDTDVEVVKLTVRLKADGSTATYYFGLEHFRANGLYSGSPVIHPLLASSPETNWGVDRYAGIRFDVTFQIYGKTDFITRGFTFADLLSDHEFHDAEIQVLYYPKPSGTTTTHTDAVNIRWTGLVGNTDYDDTTGLVTIQARTKWFKDRDFGRKFEDTDFGSGAADYSAKWRTEQAPVVFGDDTANAEGVVVTSCPIVESTIVADTHDYQRFLIATGSRPTTAGSIYTIGAGGSLYALYLKNPFNRLNSANYLEAYLASGAVSSRAPRFGPSSLVSGTEFSGKTWRFAKKIDLTAATKAEFLSGASFEARRVGVIAVNDGKLRVFVQKAVQVTSTTWNLVENPLYERVIDASAMSTSAGENHAPFDEQPWILPPGHVYLVVQEWTKHNADSKTISAAPPTGPTTTITTNGDHNWSTGASVTISGALGNTGINGTHTITVTGVNTYTIPVDTSAGGAYTANSGTAERNAYVTLHLNSGDTSEPCFVNAPGTEDNVWTQNSSRFQLQLWPYSKSGSGTVTSQDIRLDSMGIVGWAKGDATHPINGLDFKVGVKGLLDNTFPVYPVGGANGAAIDNPPGILLFILTDAPMGLGLDFNADVENTAFTALRSSLDAAGSPQDMAFVVEQTISCEELINKICDQARLVIYSRRDGVITLRRPIYQSDWTDFLLSEGHLRGEMQVLDQSDNNFSQIVNKIEGAYQQDSLLLNTDPAFLRISRDPRFLGLEYVHPNTTGFTFVDPQIAAKAFKSFQLYGVRQVLERYDLYDRAQPVYHTLEYKICRYSELQKRLTVRLPRARFHQVDLFDTVTLAHSAIRAKTGTTGDEAVKWQSEGTPIDWYSEGHPASWVNCGDIRGEVVRIGEAGPWIDVTIETVSPYRDKVRQ